VLLLRAARCEPGRKRERLQQQQALERQALVQWPGLTGASEPARAMLREPAVVQAQPLAVLQLAAAQRRAR
jgi:hypothetical protein